MNWKKMPEKLFGHRLLVLLDPVVAIGLEGQEMELPDKRSYDPTVGSVFLVGDSQNTMQTRIVPIPVVIGDRVLMAEVGFEPIEINGFEGTYRLCHGDDLIALLEPKPLTTVSELLAAGKTEITVHEDGKATEGI